MSYVILCRGKRAEQPYRVEDTGQRLYCIEELCYYIYSNAGLCEQELIKEELVGFVEKQCALPDLAASMQEVLDKDPLPERIAAQIFAYTDYLTRPQRDAVCEKIRRSGLLSINERRKSRADYLYLDGKYRDAIAEYEKLLEAKAYDSGEVCHGILYNVGCCYARMYYYDIAYGWFLKAADREEGGEEDMRAAVFCKRMLLNDKEWENYLRKHKEFAVYAAFVEKKLSEAKLAWEKQSLAKELEDMKAGGRDKHYYEKLSGMIEEWKRQI